MSAEKQAHERRFHRGPAALRAPERVALLEVPQVIVAALEGLEVRSLLEVGTGSGLLAESFAARGPRVVGVDVNPEMVAAARGYVPQGSFCVAVAEALPFLDGAFDLAFLGLVLHETDNPLQALREARRVARQRVLVFEWSYMEGSAGPPLAHRLSHEQIVALAHQAGWRELGRVELSHTVLYRLDL